MPNPTVAVDAQGPLAPTVEPVAPVRVAVRVRPLTKAERRRDPNECVQAKPATNGLARVLVTDDGQPLYGGGTVTLQGAQKRRVADEKTAFYADVALGPDATQEQVFDACIAPLIDGFVSGYNATALAYGPTGTGKTYTMGSAPTGELSLTQETNSESAGMIARAARAIFARLAERAQESRAAGALFASVVSASFVELYNDEVLDLLTGPLSRPADAADDRPKAPLRIFEDAEGRVVVQNAIQRTVASAEEVLLVLKEGAFNRQVADNGIHERSSRSHAILTLSLLAQVEDLRGSVQVLTQSSKFHLVDLAGSERIKKNRAEGARAREGIAINTELHVLAKVMAALYRRARLGDAAARELHVPYRDSKLTRILQDSLGGTSRTALIACVSPSTSDLFETRNTLRYASQARRIRNRLVRGKGEGQDGAKRLAQLRSELEAMRAQVVPAPESLESSQQSSAASSSHHLPDALPETTATPDPNPAATTKLDDRANAYLDLREQLEATQRQLEAIKTERDELVMLDRLATQFNGGTLIADETLLASDHRASIGSLVSCTSPNTVRGSVALDLRRSALRASTAGGHALLNEHALWQRCLEYEATLQAATKAHDAKLHELVQRWEDAQGIVARLTTQTADVSAALADRDRDVAQLAAARDENNSRAAQLAAELLARESELAAVQTDLARAVAELETIAHPPIPETQSIAVSPISARGPPPGVTIAKSPMSPQSSPGPSRKEFDALLADCSQTKADHAAALEQLDQLRLAHRREIAALRAQLQAAATKPAASPVEAFVRTAASSTTDSNALEAAQQAANALQVQFQRQEEQLASTTARCATVQAELDRAQELHALDKAALEQLTAQLSERQSAQLALVETHKDARALQSHMNGALVMLERIQQTSPVRTQALAQQTDAEQQSTILRLQTQATYLEALRLVQDETLSEYEQRIDDLQQALQRALGDNFELVAQAALATEENRRKSALLAFMQTRDQPLRLQPAPAPFVKQGSTAQSADPPAPVAAGTTTSRRARPSEPSLGPSVSAALVEAPSAAAPESLLEHVLETYTDSAPAADEVYSESPAQTTTVSFHLLPRSRAQ